MDDKLNFSKGTIFEYFVFDIKLKFIEISKWLARTHICILLISDLLVIFTTSHESSKKTDNVSFDQTTEDLTDTEKEILLSQVKGQTTDKKKDKKGFVN